MNSVTIELPIPSRLLHPNGRPHWAAKAKAAKRSRGLAYIMARNAVGVLAQAPKWKAATLRADWYFKVDRKRDDDGLTGWLKAYRDGIADAGIVADDCGITTLPHSVNKSSEPRVRITVERSE